MTVNLVVRVALPYNRHEVVNLDDVPRNQKISTVIERLKKKLETKRINAQGLKIKIKGKKLNPEADIGTLGKMRNIHLEGKIPGPKYKDEAGSAKPKDNFSLDLHEEKDI